MKASTALFLLSLVFFLSGGVFFAIGEGLLAGLDIVIGLIVGGIALWRRRRSS